MSILNYDEIEEINGFKKIPLGKGKDLRNNKYGMLTPLYRTENDGKKTIWVCQCDCGAIKAIDAHNFTRTNPHVRSCGCLSTPNLINQKFGKLTVLQYSHSTGGHRMWECICECGNKTIVDTNSLVSGHTKSCGCLLTETRHINGLSRKIDLTGKRFGKLLVLYDTNKRTNTHNVIWHCRCDCGNEIDITNGSLQGGTQSCGCLVYSDLTNKRFGKLVAIKRTGESTSYNSAIWECKCDCGNICYYPAQHLSQGDAVSCGCSRKSGGVIKIENILKLHNIEYIEEKIYDNLYGINTKRHLRFDFYLPKYNYLIEYDGEQHFKPVSRYGGVHYLEKLQTYDKIKNQYCIDNHIPLIRIPYTKDNTLCIEDLLLETTTFRVEGT